VATSATVNPASTADADEVPEGGVQDDNGGDHTPNRDAIDGSIGGDEVRLP
jgi:hypothetical protein